MKRVITIALTLALGACGGQAGGDANSADDAADDAPDAKKAAGKGPRVELKHGTVVCISATAGVRYGLEDALEERGLEVARSCMSADVEIEESGAAGAWALKHRALGEEWEKCESSVDERQAFLGECLGAMGATVSSSE